MREPTQGRLRRRGWSAGLTILVVLAATSTVLATPAAIPSVELNGGGGAIFDPDNDDWGCSDGTSSSTDGFYTPADDGTLGAQSDAFDSALILYVGDDGFKDPDDTGNEVGEQITVGPRSVGGLRVTRIDRALPGSRTLRSLIKLENTGRTAKTRHVSLDTEFGADEDLIIEKTSSGNLRFNSQDRWGIVSDASPFSDPVATLVNYGKGNVLKPAFQIGPYPDTANDAADCVLDVFKVRVPGKSTVYLMFFIEMSANDTDAADSVKKFNNRGLTAALRAGLAPGVRSKILNWDLP